MSTPNPARAASIRAVELTLSKKGWGERLCSSNTRSTERRVPLPRSRSKRGRAASSSKDWGRWGKAGAQSTAMSSWNRGWTRRCWEKVTLSTRPTSRRFSSSSRSMPSEFPTRAESSTWGHFRRNWASTLGSRVAPKVTFAPTRSR